MLWCVSMGWDMVDGGLYSDWWSHEWSHASSSHEWASWEETACGHVMIRSMSMGSCRDGARLLEHDAVRLFGAWKLIKIDFPRLFFIFL